MAINNGPEMQIIRARYAGNCYVCKGRVEQGTECYYNRGVRKLQHISCPPAQANMQAKAQELLNRFVQNAGNAPENARKLTPPHNPRKPHWDAAPQPAPIPPEKAPTRGAEALGDDHLAQLFPHYAVKRTYASTEDFLADVRNPARRTKGWQEFMERVDLSWNGVTPEDIAAGQGATNGEKLASMASNGWQRGADRLAAAMEGLEIPGAPRSIRRKRIRAEQGAEVDVTAYWQGRPDIAWTDCRRQERPSVLRYTLVNDAIERGSVDADQLFWRGAAVATLTDLLSKAGYAVRVLSAWHTPDEDGLAVSVTVKDFADPIDLITLAATCACPAFFRTLGHAWGNAHEAGMEGQYRHGYSVKPWPQDPSAIVARNNQAWTAETARAWVMEQLAIINPPAQQAA